MEGRPCSSRYLSFMAAKVTTVTIIKKDFKKGCTDIKILADINKPTNMYILPPNIYPILKF